MKRFAELHERLEALVGVRTLRLMRYLISGGTAAASNLTALFLLVHIGRIYYVHASILAFVMSIAVSFTLQKFWTFRDTPLHDMHVQFARYLTVILASLLLNTALVYLFVEKIGMWYLSAQLFATAIISVAGYFAYKLFVFRERILPIA